MVRGCPYWTMQDFRPFLPILSYTQEMFDLHSSSDQFVPSPTPLAVCFHFSFLFFFLTQSSHAFDFSFQTLFLRVTHNAKKRDRETSPASNQTPWPWPCPLFCLTAQSQANTGRFPLSQAGEGGGFGSLAGDQIYGTVTIPHSPSDEVAESVAESDP